MGTYVATIGQANSFSGRFNTDRFFYLTESQYYGGEAVYLWNVDSGRANICFDATRDGSGTIQMPQGDYPTSITLTAIGNNNGQTAGGIAHGFPDVDELEGNLYLSDIDGSVDCLLATIILKNPDYSSWSRVNLTFDLSQNGYAPQLAGKKLALRLRGMRGLELWEQVRVTINTANQGALIHNEEPEKGELSFDPVSISTYVTTTPGTPVLLRPVPKTGWVIDSIETVPAEFANSIVSADGAFTFTMPSYNVEFTPHWKVGNYRITASISPSVGGIVELRKESGREGDPIASANAGETVYFTFVSNPGYGKPKVKLTDNIKFTGPNPENGTDLGTRIVYEANTSEDPVSNGESGTGTTPSDGNNENTDEDDAVPNGNSNNYAYEYSFAMPSKDVVINIVVEEDTFFVNVLCDPPDGGEAVIDDADMIVKYGTVVKAKQAAKDGYQFESWRFERSDVNDPETVIVSDENRIRYYVYEARIETLRELMKEDKPGSKEYNQHLDELNELISYRQNLGYVFTMPSYDVDLTVTYTKKPYSITVSSNYNDAGINLVAVDKEFLTLNEYKELHAEDDPSGSGYETYITNQKISSGSYSTPTEQAEFYDVYTGHIGETITLVQNTQARNMYVFVGWTVSYGYITDNITPDEYGVARFTMPAAVVKIVAKYRKRDIVWATKDMTITRSKHTFTITSKAFAIDSFGYNIEYLLYKDGEYLGTFDLANGNKLSFTMKKADFDSEIELKIVARSEIATDENGDKSYITSDGPTQIIFAPAPTNMFSYYNGDKFEDVQLHLYNGSEWVEF